MYLEQSELLCCVLMVQVNVPPPDLRSVHITAASRPARGCTLVICSSSFISRQQLIQLTVLRAVRVALVTLHRGM